MFCLYVNVDLDLQVPTDEVFVMERYMYCNAAVFGIQDIAVCVYTHLI